jgi:uncharacterized protein YoaH (UPF0181 family)
MPMKINVTVDCTPKELREFLGWPDVEPLQREMMEKLSEVMSEGVSSTDAMNMMRPFVAPNMQAFEAMQKAFLQAFQSGMGSGRSKDD